MNAKILLPLAVLAATALPACNQKTRSRTSEDLAHESAVLGEGPQTTAGEIPEPPPIQDPGPNETLYVAYVVDKSNQRPIGNAYVTLLHEKPEPLFMREPRRKHVIAENYTPAHGRFHALAQADGEMKWILVHGTGFDPYVIEGGLAQGGQRHEKTIAMEILPVAKFIVRLPNGDRAAQAICTMKPHTQSTADASGRPGGSSNYGMTERADDFGEVHFNRRPGTYRLEFAAQTNKHRHYQVFEWSGQQDDEIEITLPQESMEKPW